MCRIGSAGGTSRVRGVQLLPRPPPERPPLSSRQWSRRCCRHSREDTAGEQLAHITRWRRRRHGWRRYSRKKQDVGNRETGTHETQSKLSMGRKSRRRWAVVESHGQPRLLEALVTPPHPPSDPQNHPTTIRLPAWSLESIPPLRDVLPVRPKFCLLSEDR